MIKLTTKQIIRALMVPTLMLGAIMTFRNDMMSVAVFCVFLAGMYTSAFLRRIGEDLGIPMGDGP